uniref:uncharacterized protein LOC122586263 n=1 Tax=Erigeron canadensis TaxID=72917 RepID=UPI001CB92BC0|nr:uncharacterized protein LOC122586263 [Erigeron canadensis]
MVKKKDKMTRGRRSALAIQQARIGNLTVAKTTPGGFYFPLLGESEPSSDPLIIQATVFNVDVRRVYLDGGSECDVIFEHCFLKMPESIRARRTDPRGPLVGFSGEHAWPLGEVDLDVTITDGIHERTETLDLSIVRSPSPYNIILGRPAMQRMKMVPSVIHRVIKFQSETGIGSIHSSYEPIKQINDVKRVDDDVPPTPMETQEEEDATKLVINPNFPEQTISIGAQLSEGCKH